MSQDSLTFKVSRLYRVNGEGALRAFADLSIADSILIRGIRIIEGQKGLFVSMPKQQGKDSRWYDTVRPLSKEMREEISTTVLTAYKSE